MKNSPFYNFSKIVGGPPFSFFYPHTSNHRERIPKEGKAEAAGAAGVKENREGAAEK